MDYRLIRISIFFSLSFSSLSILIRMKGSPTSVINNKNYYFGKVKHKSQAIFHKLYILRSSCHVHHTGWRDKEVKEESLSPRNNVTIFPTLAVAAAPPLLHHLFKCAVVQQRATLRCNSFNETSFKHTFVALLVHLNA